jgi:site-specific DNA-methyltransferase (adenine-specific)
MKSKSKSGQGRSLPLQGETFLDGRITLHCGDSLEILPKLEENTFDSCICDPPYHLQSIVKRFAKTGRTDKTRTTSGPHQRTANGFMNQVWDGGDVAFKVETWEKVLRVLKPGAYIVAFSSSRTFGRMSVAIEDAGFITLPLTGWIFGSGFPKAHRVRHSGLSDLDRETNGWEGYRYGGQVLKPALEPIYIGQKPFSEETGAANVQRWGCGAMNIDGCRVFADDQDALAANWDRDTIKDMRGGNYIGGVNSGIENTSKAGLGRWPANIMTDGSPEVFASFPDTSSGLLETHHSHGNKTDSVYGKFAHNEQDQDFGGDSGSAARFFWSSKAGYDDRLGSNHPTVKPVDLIQELCRLYNPPGALVLDPFAGTGTTAEACFREGMRCCLVEREAQYQADIRRRIGLLLAGPEERRRESIKAKTKDKPIDAGPLFGGGDL